MKGNPGEEPLRSVALQNAQTIQEARHRTETELLDARAALEQKSQELQQQREWFEVTLSSIGDAVITTDTRERITFMNPIAELLTGWRKEDAAGKTLSTVFPIIDMRTRKPAVNPIAEVMRHGRIVAVANHTALLSKHGAEIVIEDRAAPIRDPQGNIVGAVMVFHDAKAKREAADALCEETQALRILNETGGAIAAQLDIDAVGKRVADAATEISGAEFGAFFYTNTDPHGHVLTLHTLSGAAPDQLARLEQPQARLLFESIFAGKPAIRIDDILDDPRCAARVPQLGKLAGQQSLRSYMAVPVISRTGAVIGGLLFGHSAPGVFTERAEHIVTGIAGYAAIAIDNARLFQDAQLEIGRRQQVEETLQATDRLKDEFLAILAHELRNPLAPIRQAASVWTQANLSAEQLRWSQRVVDRQSRHMSMLLDDLMDISRIKRGHMVLRKEWTQLGAIVEAAVETASPLLRSRDHQLNIAIEPPDLHLNADPVRLTQILANLLNNAAKYTPPQGRIELTARIIRGTAEISIIDNGTGISSELLPHIFSTFFQSSAALDRVEGGLGLGLALVKGIVALHGGDVRVSSGGLGAGSEFMLLLPVGEDPHKPVSSPASDSPSNRNGSPPAHHILIADDNRDMADSLALYMQLRGHVVTTVYSGEEALQAFAAQAPGIVILDIGMPRLNGYETARRIRAMQGELAPLLLALTGWGQENDKKLAVEAGFDHHFTKPVNPEKLVELFEQPVPAF